MSYLDQIIKNGTETLEKFLFLFKEDIILFREREERNKNKYSEEETIFFLEKFQKWTNKGLKEEKVEISKEDFFLLKDRYEDFTNFSKSQFLASNAHFIYLFALFDQFILEISKIALKSDPSLMQNYIKYCITFYESGKDKNLYKLLPYEDKLIDYFSKFSSPITVITKILGIDFKKEELTDNYFNFIEMKERRNLIVHRGGVCDELYLKTIKKYLSKFPPKKLNNFLSELEENKNKNLNIDLVYFLETIQNLYFLVCLLVSRLISKENLKTKKINLFTQSFNDLLNFSLENDYGIALTTTALDLFKLYESEYLNNDLSKMIDEDKVNWILCNEKYKEMALIAYSESNKLNEVEKKEAKTIKSKLIKISNIKNELLINNIEDQLVKKIITSFLEKNFQIFTENIFLYAKREGYLLKDIESGWYMHKKLSEEIEFRKIYSSFKKENNFMPENFFLEIDKNTKNK